MSSRTDILDRLRTTLDKVHNPTVRYSRAEQRIHDAAPTLLPRRGQAEGAAKTALFMDEAIKADAEVHQLARMDDVPAAVASLLERSNIQNLKAAPHETLQAMNWPGLDVSFGPGEGDDHVGLSMAYAGVSETGTLVMISGAATPTTLNFLPDVHIVVLREEDISPNYEEVWSRLREAAKPDAPVMPRTVNWITGPSRTADIEQTLLLGAHGPRKLVILLIDAQAP